MAIRSALVVTLALVPPALGASPPAPPLPATELVRAAHARGELDADTAALYRAFAVLAPERLPDHLAGAPPEEGTLELMELTESLRSMPAGPARDALAEVLSGACGSSSAPLPLTLDTAHFHIEYDVIEPPLTIDDYAAALESAWSTLVDRFGWAPPPVLPSNPPPGDRYHVRVANGSYVSPMGAHAGLVGDNPATAWTETAASASCMVIPADMVAGAGAPPFLSDPWKNLARVAAHEFTHSLQLGYGVVNILIGNPIFIEGAADWAVDEVARDSDANYGQLWPDFSRCLSDVGAPPSSSYRYWVVLRAMTEPFGVGVAGGGEQVMQDFYEETSRRQSGDLAWLDLAFANAGSTLADAYHGAAVALQFNRPCGGGYVLPHCLDEGPGYVAAAGRPALSATIPAAPASVVGDVLGSQALDWVGLPRAGRYDLVLEGLGPGGTLRASAACDTGSALVVRALTSPVGAGGSARLYGVDPAGCASVVAVITSEERSGPMSWGCGVAAGYRLSVTLPGPRELVLFAVRAPGGRDVALSWSGGWRGFTVERGAAPDALAPIDLVDEESYLDRDAVTSPPDRWFYAVR